MKCEPSKKKPVQTIKVHPCDSNSSSSLEYEHIGCIIIIERMNSVMQMIKAKMKVKGKPIAFQIDSRASINVNPQIRFL